MKRTFFILCLLCVFNIANAQRISTAAGIGTVGGFSGDGGPATAAKLVQAYAVAIDAQGNMYLSIRGVYHSVRRVDTAGIIHAFVSGIPILPGFSGDGGPATAAQIDEPRGITFDNKGNVYFFDVNNKRVRKVDTAGIITTFAGNGTATPSGDGGPATAAGLGAVGFGLCTDTFGNIYIGANNFIRKVDTAGIITTIAGTGVGGHSGDGGMADTAKITANGQIAFDKSGNLFMCSGGYIRKINSAGIITTIAGNGTGTYTGDGIPATAAGISNTTGVFPDSNGFIYMANNAQHRIRKVSPAGIITTLAGSGTTFGFSGDGGPGTAAKLHGPTAIYMGKNNCLYIAETGNYCVRRLDLNDTIFVNATPVLHENEDAVKVYPNPAGDGVLNVRVSSAADEPVQVALIDVTGKEVHEQTTTTNKETTMTLHTPPGLYLLHISKADKQWVQKVLVE